MQFIFLFLARALITTLAELQDLFLKLHKKAFISFILLLQITFHFVDIMTDEKDHFSLQNDHVKFQRHANWAQLQSQWQKVSYHKTPGHWHNTLYLLRIYSDRIYNNQANVFNPDNSRFACVKVCRHSRFLGVKTFVQ